MANGLHGRRVLITGASGGIGSAIAKEFAAHGAILGLQYKSNSDAGNDLLRDARALTRDVELFSADLLEADAPCLLMHSFIDRFGGIDVLINNAGATFDYAHFSQLDPCAWQRTFDLNVRAPFYLCGMAFEHMKKCGGRIINISSVNVKYGGSAKSMHYCASKAALDSLTIGFAREGAHYNILVNSIRCGLIDTPMRSRIDGYSEENFRKRMDMVPLGRAGSPTDIARMAAYLAGEGGNFITGEIMTIAGGD